MSTLLLVEPERKHYSPQKTPHHINSELYITYDLDVSIPPELKQKERKKERKEKSLPQPDQ